MDLEELSKSPALDVSAKLFPFVAASSYIFGLVFLNICSYRSFGLIDLSLSNAVCVATAFLAITTLLLVNLLRYSIDMIVKVAARVNTEFVRALTFLLTMLFGCLHRWFFNVPAKGNPDAEVLAKWIVKATYLCLWLTFLLATMAPSFWGDHIRLFLQEHNFALSPYKKIFVSAIALYVVSISMLVAPVMILMESGKAVQKSKRPVRFIVGVTKLLCVPVMFSLLYFIVAATYLLVPARFGGAGPDPILLWISPNSARSLVIDGFVPNDLGCSGSDFVVLRDLSLVHEGPDYYYLVIGDSSKGTYISKDMVKRRHWIDRMDQATIDKFKEKAFLCIPVAQAQLAEK